MKKIFTLFVFLCPVCCLAQSRRDSITHRDSTHQLNEVTVSGNTQKLIKQAPGNLAIVDVKPYYSSGITPVQLLRGTSGIKVRQDGGYGSTLNFFINGSTGRQLKFFLDGMPLDNLGQSLGLNNLPVEQIERMEIYKGIVPVELGADVLGGAINVVTRRERNDYFDASYAIGSFDTHRLNLSGRKGWSPHFYTSFQGYTGYSKNNYGIDARNILLSGQFDTIHVKRFHDRYKNYVLRAEAGLTNVRWADVLSLALNASGYDKQLQSNLTMDQPYRFAGYREHLLGGMVRYQKANLVPRLNLSGYLSYNRIQGLFIDTSRRTALWDGSFAKVEKDGILQDDIRTRGGEQGPTTFQDIYTHVLQQKTVAAYRWNDHHRLIFSNTLQLYRRTGRDTLAQRLNNGADLYSSPSSQLKNISGLGWDGSFWNDQLKISAAIKNFYVHTSGVSVINSIQYPATVNQNKLGYSLAGAYQFNSANTIKLSFEHAIRLPDADESFGERIQLVNSNPGLRPEESNNINLNLLHLQERSSIEFTGFYRDVNHLIYFVPDYSGHTTARNLYGARILGAEVAGSYEPIKNLSVNANTTFQDLRNLSYLENEEDPENPKYVGQRIPNIPYLLANAGVSYRMNNFGLKNGRLQVYYTLSYTHAYFLYWPNEGDKSTKNQIPMQFLQNAGLSYSLRQLNFSLETFNLANAKAYDNFKAQLPGRSFSFKVRYYISKQILKLY